LICSIGEKKKNLGFSPWVSFRLFLRIAASLWNAFWGVPPPIPLLCFLFPLFSLVFHFFCCSLSQHSVGTLSDWSFWFLPTLHLFYPVLSLPSAPFLLTTALYHKFAVYFRSGFLRTRFVIPCLSSPSTHLVIVPTGRSATLTGLTP